MKSYLRLEKIYNGFSRYKCDQPVKALHSVSQKAHISD